MTANEVDDVLGYWRSDAVVLCDRRLTVLGATTAARGLTGAFRPGENLARFAFLSPHRQSAHPRWRESAAITAGLLRGLVDEHDQDRASQHLLGELASGSREFSELWARADDGPRSSGSIVFESTRAGTVALTFHVLGVPGREDHVLLVFTPAGREARQALDRLAATSGSASSTEP